MSLKANEIRKGKVLVFDGELFVVTHHEHRKPGKGSAFNQIKCKHFKTGVQKQMKMSSDQTVEEAYLDKKDCEYLYQDGEAFVFMDQSDYEQYSVPTAVVEDQMVFVKPNQTVLLTFFQGNPVNLDLPASVTLQVAEAEMAVKGDSVTSDKKNATLETGLAVKVPMYIEAGEFVKVSTETGEFQARAKGPE